MAAKLAEIRILDSANQFRFHFYLFIFINQYLNFSKLLTGDVEDVYNEFYRATAVRWKESRRRLLPKVTRKNLTARVYFAYRTYSYYGFQFY